jgi:hypothetical protein
MKKEHSLMLLQPEIRVVAAIPVHGRLPLLRQTIRRLYDKNNVYRVICVGGQDEESVCRDNGAEFVHHPNILGAKWNIAFQEAGRLGATHVLFVGSSDFVSDTWTDYLIPKCPLNGMIGLKGFHMAHISDNGIQAGYWHGYKTARALREPIGIGRIISAGILDKMDWKPFYDTSHKSMDGAMTKKVVALEGQIEIIDTKEIKSLSISTDRWKNKHTFGISSASAFTYIGHPVGWLMDNFPETLLIFKN